MRRLIPACGILLLLNTAISAAVIADEQFTDNERLTQGSGSPLTSLQWTVGAHHNIAANAVGNLSVSGGQMKLDHTISSSDVSFAGTWAYFTPTGSPLNLVVGDSLKLSYEVTMTNGSFVHFAQAFRVGLLNSNNSRVTADFVGTSENGLSSGTSFSTWRGYEFNTTVTDTTGGSDVNQLRERTGAGNGLNASANWTSLLNDGDSPLFTLNQPAIGSFTLFRTATGIEVTSVLNGVTKMATDTSDLVTAFDTINFFTTSSENYDLVFDNIKVEFNSIPEPTTWAALSILILTLGISMYRRRQTLAQRAA